MKRNTQISTATAITDENVLQVLQTGNTKFNNLCFLKPGVLSIVAYISLFVRQIKIPFHEDKLIKQKEGNILELLYCTHIY